MKYATWTISQPEGTTPEVVIRQNGGVAEGGVTLLDNTIIGYISDDINIEDLSEWNVVVKTQQEALTLAQTVNPECFLADNGTIQAPRPDAN